MQLLARQTLATSLAFELNGKRIDVTRESRDSVNMYIFNRSALRSTIGMLRVYTGASMPLGQSCVS